MDQSNHLAIDIQGRLSGQSLQEFHARGGTREQIESALRIMPFVGVKFIQAGYLHIDPKP